VTRLVRAELFKLRTTPGPWVVLAATLGFTALGIVAAFLVSKGVVITRGGAVRRHLEFVAPTTVNRLRRLIGAGFEGGGVWMAAVIGVLGITGEYRHKVMTTTLLAQPVRWRVLVAKSIASVIWGLGLGIASLVIVAAMGVPLFVSQGGALSALSHQVGAVVPGLLGAFALMALLGVGFGSLLQNQVASVLVVLGVALILEPIFDGLVPAAGRWLPSAAAAAVAGGSLATGTAHAQLLAWWLAVIVLVAWGLVPTVLGFFATFSRDVT